MTTIRLTAKRQATLPKALCEEMHLRPGDALLVDGRVVGGQKVWLLKPVCDAQPSWFGALKKYGRGKRHGMASVRRSIEKARRHDR
jgi:bifunctional DNA-binding transcriptional regulator/antitoxin component of YhaV-PrlF toxin-antitoxin module